MPAAAPRIDERLVAALARFDARDRPIAETHRRVGRLADELRLTRPSYQQVRVVVHALRAARRSSVVGETLLDVALQRRPPVAILDALTD